MPSINDFHQSSANWRETIRRNTQRSYLVMATYVVIYICLGLLIDTYLYSRGNQLPLSVIFQQIITLHWFPYITSITTAVAIISLLVTLSFADQLMLLGTQYKLIEPNKINDPEEIKLYNLVEEMKIAAGMKFMPKVYIIEADYMNAFASGWSEKSAMVAITRGLMQKLNRAELQAVMAHELTHIRHQDIKLTLCASVLSQLILMVIDVMFYATVFGGNDRDNNRNASWLFMVIMVLRFVLPLITVLLMLYLSRKREFMADAGAVELMRDNQPMASALCKIAQDHAANEERYSFAYQQNGHEQVRQQAYIFDPGKAGIKANNTFSDLFSTHPSIKRRLQALGFLDK